MEKINEIKETSIKLVRLDQLVDLLNVGERTWLRWVKNGQAPRPIRLGPRAVAWRLSQLESWLEQKQRAGRCV